MTQMAVRTTNSPAMTQMTIHITDSPDMIRMEIRTMDSKGRREARVIMARRGMVMANRGIIITSRTIFRAVTGTDFMVIPEMTDGKGAVREQ